MNPSRLRIQEEGEQLPVGSTINITCPYCQSAWEGEGRPSNWHPTKSMSITRQATGIVWYCFRASCREGNRGGIVSSFPSDKAELLASRKKPFRRKEFKGTTDNIPEDIYNKFLAPYSISKEEAEYQGIKFSKYLNRLYFPVYNKNGWVIGEQTKTTIKGEQPKNILYRHEDVVFLHYPKGTPYIGEPIILVEDIISAVRLKVAGYRSCALLGTNLSKASLLYLTREENEIILMLDGDATNKALKYKREYGSMFRLFKVIGLPYGVDPKDLSDKELKEKIDG